MFMNLLLGGAAAWLALASWLVLLAAAAWYHFRRGPAAAKRLAWLCAAALALKLFFAGWATWGQWSFWRANLPELIGLPLDASVRLEGWLRLFEPLKDVAGGYFWFYAFGRFWLAVAITLLTASLWWLVLRLIDRYRPGALLPGETSLGWLTAVLAGWPGFLVYLPLSLGLALLAAAYRAARSSAAPTRLGWSFILSALVALLSGPYLIRLVAQALSIV